MMPILQIGPLAIPLPGLLLLAGLWLGLELAERNAHRFGLQASSLYNLTMVMLLAGVAGARLEYALRYPAEFAASPAGLVSLDSGLLDPAGGLAGALIAGLIYGSRKGLAWWPALDAFTPLLTVMGVALALSHLASGTAFGAPADLPWSISLWGARRHPAQLYELLAAALILAVMWPGRKGQITSPPGRYFLTFVALSAGARLFLEAFRGDSQLLPLDLPVGSLRLAQLAAWLALAASLWGLFHLGGPENKGYFDSDATSEPEQHLNQ